MLSACTSSGGFYRSRKWKSGASLKNRKAAAERGGGLYSLSLQTLGRTDCIISARPESQEGHSDEWLTLWEERLECPPPAPRQARGWEISQERRREQRSFLSIHKIFIKSILRG